MKLTLLEDLVCLFGGELELTRILESESQDSQEIMSGWLHNQEILLGSGCPRHWKGSGKIRGGDQRISRETMLFGRIR